MQSWSRTRIALCLLALAAPLLVGCSGSDEPSRTASTTPTSLAELDARSVQVARVTFCDRVTEAAVRRALGADPEQEDGWGRGDPAPGTAAGDVSDELGCGWTGPGGAAARAWVFGRPATAEFATGLVRQAGVQKGCTAEPDATFGNPAVLQTCTRPAGVQRVRRAGLFGDTWLTCELTAPATTPGPGLRSRLDAWCATVVAALDTSG